MDEKKKALAQLFCEALEAFHHNHEVINDAVYLISGRTEDYEERWKIFSRVFEETFGIPYEEAKKLRMF